jgi:hypothetical protein
MMTGFVDTVGTAFYRAVLSIPAIITVCTKMNFKTINIALSLPFIEKGHVEKNRIRSAGRCVFISFYN